MSDIRKKFTHLHLHTDFSILDAPMTVAEAVERAAEMEMSSIALTDHGSMCGAIRFQVETEKAGIKPIFGNEFYITKTDFKLEDGMDPKLKRGNYAHILLLAKNDAGLSSLTRLTSRGATEGFYYRPRIDIEMLSQEADNLICLTACISGYVATHILEGKHKQAFRKLRALKTIFGDDLYYEIQFNEIPEQQTANNVGIAMARSLDIPLIYTSDVHYARPEDNEVQDIMNLVRFGKTISEMDEWSFDARSLYLKGLDDVGREYLMWHGGVSQDDFKESIVNVALVAERCNATFKVDDYQYPEYNTDGRDIDEIFLEQVSERFLKLTIPNSETDRYVERLGREVKLMRKKNLQSYFMIISDLMDFARSNNIPVGPGRGSVGGSLVAYALGITGMDPMQFDLSFDRFLSEERTDLPDIDLDFSDWGRGLAIDYLSTKYGEDRVLPIIAFSKLHVKGIIRDVGKALEIDSYKLTAASKEIDKIYWRDTGKMEELVEKKYFQEFFRKYPLLLKVARKLEGKIRHMSRHAAGVVVTPVAAAGFVPIVKSGDILHCGFDYEPYYLSLDHLKVLKIDILGLTTLSIIGDTYNYIAKNEKEFDEDNFEYFDDKGVYKEMQEGNTIGSFQMEGAGYRRLLRGIKPDRFKHLIAAVALFRPSTLAAGIDKEYIKRKRTNFRHENPIIGEVLDETYGCMVYQEQIMSLASELGGLTLGEADVIRKSLTKWQSTKVSDFKGRDAIEDFREKFIQGAIEQHIDEGAASAIFDQMAKFSLYGFNKSHAAAYAIIAYKTMYMKLRFPLEYMTSLLRHTPAGVEYRGRIKLNIYIEEAERIGLTILPPDINLSNVNFEPDEDDDMSIRIGLSIIKWVGESSAQKIINVRPFTDFDDFIDKAGSTNSRAIRSMLAAGCFSDECFGSEEEAFTKLKAFKNIEADSNDITKKSALFGIEI